MRLQTICQEVLKYDIIKIHGLYPGSIELHFNEVKYIGDLFLIGSGPKLPLPITVATC